MAMNNSETEKDCIYCGNSINSDAKFCHFCGKSQEKDCPVCLKKISVTAKFCRFCGTDLETLINCPNCSEKIKPTATFCRWCGTVINDENLIECQNCSKKIRPSALFCHWCGAEITQPEKTQTYVIEAKTQGSDQQPVREPIESEVIIPIIPKTSDSSVSVVADEQISENSISTTDIEQAEESSYTEEPPIEDIPVYSETEETVEDTKSEVVEPVYNEPVLETGTETEYISETSVESEPEIVKEFISASPMSETSKFNETPNPTIQTVKAEAAPVIINNNPEAFIDDENVIFCSNCHSALKNIYAFCPICGTKVEYQDKPEDIEYKPKKVVFVNKEDEIASIQKAIDEAASQNRPDKYSTDTNLTSLKQSLKALVSMSVEPLTPNSASSPEFNKQTLYLKHKLSHHLSCQINTTDLGLFIRYKMLETHMSGLTIRPCLSFNTNRASESGMFGNGWHFNYSSAVFRGSSADTFTVTSGDGDSSSFTTRQISNEKPRVLLPIMHETGELVQGDDSFVYRGVDNMYYKYSSFTNTADYYLEYVSDAYGNALTLTYDGLKIKDIMDTAGRKFLFKYDDRNRCISMELSDGTMFKFEYDNLDNLTCITDTENKNIFFNYSSDGLLTSISDSPYNVLYDIVYDRRGLAPVIEKITYSARKEVLFQRFDDMSTIKIIDSEKGTATVTNMKGLTISVDSFDGDHMRIIYDAINEPIVIGDQEYSYDSSGNCIGKSDNQGNSYSYSFDEANRLIGFTDNYGKETCFEYNEKNKIIKIEDSEGYRIDMEYDSDGHLVTKKDNKNHSVRFSYDDYGNVINVFDESGLVRTMEYDDLGYNVTYDSEKVMKTSEKHYSVVPVFTYNYYPEKKLDHIVNQASL